jgi:hypothetical protein
MSSLSEALPVSGGAMIAIVLVAATALYLFTRSGFWWTDMSYRLPIIGKLSRFSHDFSETRRGGWLNVESTLCRDYARYCGSLSKGEFENDREYLRKAFDHGRKPLPSWALLALGALVMAEGFGFSYVLSGLMALDSSENLRFYLTWAIVFVLATILVWVTHKAGHQLYRTRLLRSCFRQYQAHSFAEDRAGERKVFTSQVVSLADDQSVDDNQPSHVQCANRIITHPGDRGNYAWGWIATALILIVAVGSIVLRAQSLHIMALEGAASADEEMAGMTGFVLLATIFVVTQIVSVGVGYSYGFGGRQSKEAYGETHGCSDFEAYFRPVRSRMSIADLRLTSLHRMMERGLPQEFEWTRDFYDFVRQERERGATDLQDPMALAGRTPPPVKKGRSLEIVDGNKPTDGDGSSSAQERPGA